MAVGLEGGCVRLVSTVRFGERAVGQRVVHGRGAARLAQGQWFLLAWTVRWRCWGGRPGCGSGCVRVGKAVEAVAVRDGLLCAAA